MSGSVSSSNSTTPLLSGLSPDLARETSSPGLSGGSAFPPYISSAPPLIDSVQTPSSFCSGRRTHSAAYSELPEPVSTRFRIPAKSCLRLSREAIIRSQVRSQVQGCWQISRSVWKYPRRSCSASGRPNNSAARVCWFVSRRCQSACVNDEALSMRSYIRYREIQGLSAGLQLGGQDVQRTIFAIY